MYVCVECSHASVFELEVADLQVSVGMEVAQHAAGTTAAGGQSVERHSMEVDEVQHVADVDVLHTDLQRVEITFRCRTVNHQVLLIVAHGEVEDIETVIVVGDVAGLDVPRGTIDSHFRRCDVDVRYRLVFQGGVEFGRGSQCAAHAFGSVVLPEEGCRELVVVGAAGHLQVELVAVAHEFGDAEVAEQGVHGRHDAEVAVVVAAVLIVHLRGVAGEDNLLHLVVYGAVDRQWLSERDGHL